MSELGRLLKQGRETQGLTLADVEDSTHIRKAYLAALEEGRKEALPNIVYTRGLVLNYGHFLGLDEQELSGHFQAEYGRPLVTRREIGSHQPLSEPLSLASQTWVRALAVAVVIAVVAFAAWWYWPVLRPWGRWLVSLARVPQRVLVRPFPTATTTLPALGGKSATETAVLALDVPTAAVAAESPDGSAALPTSAALPLPTPTTRPTETTTPSAVAPTATPVQAQGVAVSVNATSPAWMRVTVDGEIAYEGTLNTGETRQWSGQRSVLIYTGNGGGTEVTVNGNSVGPLGGGGEVVERLWLWQDGQVVSATPEG